MMKQEFEQLAGYEAFVKDYDEEKKAGLVRIHITKKGIVR